MSFALSSRYSSQLTFSYKTYYSSYRDVDFFLSMRIPPISTLFPYTTLFRSLALQAPGRHRRVQLEAQPAAVRIELNSDRKSTRLNSSHTVISYAVFCLKKKNKKKQLKELERKLYSIRLNKITQKSLCTA